MSPCPARAAPFYFRSCPGCLTLVDSADFPLSRLMRFAILLSLSLLVPAVWGWLTYALMTRWWPFRDCGDEGLPPAGERESVPHNFQI